MRAFQAHYAGDATYTGSDGACEPLRVVDANIQITPPLATNPVGTNHVFTGHVNVNDGSGPVNAPDGTQISFTIDSGPGAFTTANPCTTSGGTGSCTITLSSAATGTTVVSAHTTVAVGGVSLTRDTNGVGANSGAATKLWADDTVADRHPRPGPRRDHDGGARHGRARQGVRGTHRGYAGCGAEPDRQRRLPPLRRGRLQRCLGRQTVALAADGTAESSTFTVIGALSYQAHYNGDANYPARDGACEPLAVQTLGTGRVTGGGSIFATINGVPNVRVTHGFELRCDPTDKRQSLEINWDGGNNFHLDKLINSVICFDDPTTQPPPPPGTAIDTYAGDTLFNGSTGFHGFGYAVGTGTCNKQPATIYFILIDAGEPGTADTAEYHIVSSGCTLDAGPAQLLKGNHQFHKELGPTLSRTRSSASPLYRSLTGTGAKPSSDLVDRRRHERVGET